ncbi:MAG: RNA-binding protein [Chloroflexi bacterium]|nr:RNA-binding protein [Chloroflexota bacterium]
MRIYVGNFAYEVTDQELRQAFEAFGKVDEVTVVRDRDTGRSKGFGFIEMPTAAEAQAAITGLNGKELRGRAITVNEARPRPAGGGFGGGGGGGGYGGGARRGSGGGGGGGGRGSRY